MANLGNLKFTLGIDDKKFSDELKKDLQRIDEIRKKLKDVGYDVGQLTNNEQKALKTYRQKNEEMRRIAGYYQKIGEAQDKSAVNLRNQSGLLGQMVRLAGTYVSIWSAGRFIRDMIRITGEFELQRTALRAMLKDLDSADKIFGQIQKLAVVSPFQFKELTGYVKQLAAFSIPKEDLYATTKMLADVSSGLGVGMDRITLAYGQIRAASFLRGFNIYGFSASQGVKNTNPFNCWNLPIGTISSQDALAA